MKRIDLGVGIFFVALGIGVILAGQELAVFTRNSPGPGFLPRGLAIIFIVTGAILAIKQFVNPSQGHFEALDRNGTLRVVGAFVLMAVVIGVMESLGFIVSMLLLMAGIMFGIERKFTPTAFLVVALVPIVFWTLFAVLLGVRLPPGVLYF